VLKLLIVKSVLSSDIYAYASIRLLSGYRDGQSSLECCLKGLFSTVSLVWLMVYLYYTKNATLVPDVSCSMPIYLQNSYSYVKIAKLGS